MGSRLIRNSIDAIQPIVSVSGEQIQRRGYTNVGTALLTENPAFAVGAATPYGSGNGSGAGQTFLNLTYNVFFNVNNITGEHPPFPYAGVSTNRYASAIIGRAFLFGFHADMF